MTAITTTATQCNNHNHNNNKNNNDNNHNYNKPKYNNQNYKTTTTTSTTTITAILKHQIPWFTCPDCFNIRIFNTLQNPDKNMSRYQSIECWMLQYSDAQIFKYNLISENFIYGHLKSGNWVCLDIRTPETIWKSWLS